MSENADKIKQHISMYDVLNLYGLKLNRRGAMCCPFHREKTASFKIYSNGAKFHCFGCGADGDVISFVMKYYDIDYPQAITRLAADFVIPIVDARRLSVKERRKLQEARRKRLKEGEEFDKEYNRLFEAYLLLCDEYSRLDYNFAKYVPKSPDEPFNELYCEAAHKLPFQKFKCEMAQIALENFEERSRKGNERGNTGASLYKRGLSQGAGAV